MTVFYLNLQRYSLEGEEKSTKEQSLSKARRERLRELQFHYSSSLIVTEPQAKENNPYWKLATERRATSGGNYDLEEFLSLIEDVLPGDTIIMESIASWTVKINLMIQLIELCRARDVRLMCEKEMINFSEPESDMVVAVLKSIRQRKNDEFKRSIRKARTIAAKNPSEGYNNGGSKPTDPATIAKAIDLVKAGKSVNSVAKELKVSQPTLRKHLKRMGVQKGSPKLSGNMLEELEEKNNFSFSLSKKQSR